LRNITWYYLSSDISQRNKKYVAIDVSFSVFKTVQLFEPMRLKNGNE